MKELFFIFSLLGFLAVSSAIEDDLAVQRSLSFFNVVKFPNDVCKGDSTRNGTCYTKEECEDKGGESSGTCAEGYGVCCIVSLGCGGSSMENCTYLVQPSTTKPPTQNCMYTICKAGPNVCRFKFEFTVFEIGAPYEGLTRTTDPDALRYAAIGHCVRDTFTIASHGNQGTPTICGFNTGQHMFVDASDGCAVANFVYSEETLTRQYDIKVLQYDCGSEVGGPPDCLQYHYGTSGSTASFNFPTTSSTVVATTTHLANQHYDICFRRESGMCAICYIPAIAIAGANAVIAQSSYGLSKSSVAIAAAGETAGGCQEDYLTVPNGQIVLADAAKTRIPEQGADRICGRVFGIADADTLAIQAMTSVCSAFRPFRLTFHTDGTELTTGAANTAILTEEKVAPGGIVGFHLNWRQIACID